MNLSQRLLAGLLAVLGILVAVLVIVAGTRLNSRLAGDTRDELEREARLVGYLWDRHPENPDSLADAAGAALRRRVTLVNDSGVVIGDSEFDGEGLRRLENHGHRPEILAARRSGVGDTVRTSSSAGDEEMYLAIRDPRGFVRVSIGTSRFRTIVAGALKDVLFASLIGLLAAIVLAFIFSRRVSQPIVELRDVTRAIADGDLDRRPSLNAPGEVGDLAASVMRMTDELRRRLEMMQEEDGRLVAIIESLDEAIVAVDARGNVVRMNGAARRLFEIADPLPFSWAQLPFNTALREAMQSALHGAGVHSNETTIRDRVLAVTSRPLSSGGAVLAVMDLTERRRLETVRRDFVANVSHELKTPLTVIGGFAETLRDPQLAPDVKQRFIDLLMANTTRMQRIVDDLLDLSRYESTTWIPKPVEVDLEQIVSDVLAGVRSAADDKGIGLVSAIAPDARTIRFDSTAIRQVITNLVENAVRYTSTGSVTVSARREHGEVVIEVRDTGVGIAAEHLSRIFERFYRADPARSRADGGTGLGLAIVRHLVEAHGGRVSAESNLGEGTSVFVRSAG